MILEIISEIKDPLEEQSEDRDADLYAPLRPLALCSLTTAVLLLAGRGNRW